MRFCFGSAYIWSVLVYKHVPNQQKKALLELQQELIFGPIIQKSIGRRWEVKAPFPPHPLPGTECMDWKKRGFCYLPLCEKREGPKSSQSKPPLNSAKFLHCTKLVDRKAAFWMIRLAKCLNSNEALHVKSNTRCY